MYPNFSHGTAGNAYFLTRLYQACGERRFLESAKSGARYLLAVADTEGGGCKVFHNEPLGLDVYYLGWCHGPVGTGRLFHTLEQATSDAAFGEWFERGARSVLRSNIPENLTDGFWNNVSVCCGSAGVIEYCVRVHESTGDDTWMRLADRLADDLLRRATPDRGGLYWIHAENRADPEDVRAQTGYMQGAAGTGLSLLHTGTYLAEGHTDWIPLPDESYGD